MFFKVGVSGKMIMSLHTCPALHRHVVSERFYYLKIPEKSLDGQIEVGAILVDSRDIDTGTTMLGFQFHN